MTWESFHTIFLRCCGISALFTNSLMFQLICYESPKNLGAYKYLMIYFAVFEFFYAAIDMIILPELHTKDSAFLIVISTAKSHVPKELLAIFHVMYWMSYGVSIALIDVHFVFRYLVVSGNKIWTFTKPSKLLIWLLYPLIFGAVHAIGCRYFLGPSDDSNRVLRETLSNDSEVDAFDGMGFFVFPNNHVNWWGVIGTLQNAIEINSSGTIMLIFGIKCYKTIKNLNSKKTKSSQYQKVQKQLFMALVLQTTIPLCLMYIPSGIIILFMLFDRLVDPFGKILCITIALYPVVDPLPNMFVIDSFRNALIKYIRKLLFLKKTKTPNRKVAKGSETSTQLTTLKV